MDIEVLSVTPATDPVAAVRAFCTVRVGPLTVHGVRLVNGRTGQFISSPSRRDPSGKWHPHVEWPEEVGEAIFAAITKAIDGAE